MDEADSIRQPESRIVQAAKVFSGKLGIYLLHESLILVGGVWARSILYDNGSAHSDLFPFNQFSVSHVWP
jgi:hypothetical protein